MEINMGIDTYTGFFVEGFSPGYEYMDNSSQLSGDGFGDGTLNYDECHEIPEPDGDGWGTFGISDSGDSFGSNFPGYIFTTSEECYLFSRKWTFGQIARYRWRG
jgi:hypothetical protein